MSALLPETRKKLTGATYHLDNMRRAYPDDRTTLDYELDAFLVKVKSSLDVMREDANVLFQLGIKMSEEMKPALLKDRANQSNRRGALEFIIWYETEKLKLAKDPFYHAFLRYEGLRNMSEHRKAAAPDTGEFTSFEKVTIAESLTLIKYDVNGNIIEESVTAEPTNPGASNVTSSKTDWYYSEVGSYNIVDACQQLWNIVNDFADRAEQKLTQLGVSSP
jgi:hypothetical protein